MVSILLLYTKIKKIDSMKTIYQLVQDAMNIEIKRYLNLLTFFWKSC
jgi:hypothetical protein